VCRTSEGRSDRSSRGDKIVAMGGIRDFIGAIVLEKVLVSTMLATV